jgi:hypothetical protein
VKSTDECHKEPNKREKGREKKRREKNKRKFFSSPSLAAFECSVAAGLQLNHHGGFCLLKLQRLQCPLHLENSGNATGCRKCYLHKQ